MLSALRPGSPYPQSCTCCTAGTEWLANKWSCSPSLPIPHTTTWTTPYPALSVEKSSSMKPIPGAKRLGTSALHTQSRNSNILRQALWPLLCRWVNQETEMLSGQETDTQTYSCLLLHKTCDSGEPCQAMTETTSAFELPLHGPGELSRIMKSLWAFYYYFKVNNK